MAAFPCIWDEASYPNGNTNIVNILFNACTCIISIHKANVQQNSDNINQVSVLGVNKNKSKKNKNAGHATGMMMIQIKRDRSTVVDK